MIDKERKKKIKKNGLEEYVKICNSISNSEDFELFVFSVFEDCQKYLRDIGIEPFSCRLIIIYNPDEYAKLQKEYRKRFGKEISDIAFTDSSMRAILGYDTIYINLQKHFSNLPTDASVVNLCLSFFEELVHSSDTSKSEMETVEIVFSTIRGFLGIELDEETKKKARARAKRFDSK